MRTAYEAHAEDDDFRPARQPWSRDVMDDAARDRLAGNIVAQLRNGVTEPMRQRFLGYLRSDVLAGRLANELAWTKVWRPDRRGKGPRRYNLESVTRRVCRPPPRR
jgi:catalase